MVLEAYYPVAIFVLIAISFPFLTYRATRLLRTDNPTPLNETTYECGEVPEGEANIQFNFQYYLFAIMFIIFDVAAIFIILFAMIYGASLVSDPLAMTMMAIFILIMTAATLYSLKKEEVYTV